MRRSLAGLLLVYSAVSLPVTGFVVQEISSCGIGEKQGNVTYKSIITFNHLTILEFNHSANNFVTYLPLKVVENFTTEFNNTIINYVKSEEKRCKDQIKTFWNNTAQRSVKPSMEVFSPEQFYGDDLPLLICHVWGFYPQDIVLSWIKNEKTLVKNVTEAIRVGDWTYQVVAKLDLRDSNPEDTYTCVVKHKSLDMPMMKSWRAGLTFVQIINISVSAAIFALGLLSLVIGVICWRGARRSGLDNSSYQEKSSHTFRKTWTRELTVLQRVE
ncbi:HLA class II histocompatibility antigen, DM beta chain-like isoform X2 [Eleutherodactylus coqui]|uniref:HLA class II histocompatibility antigen, DM beta chain-like isoform X2 n=1 Tax=Eleutherodactylus coqui TaxID=57060 RepID=UPI0034624AAC